MEFQYTWFWNDKELFLKRKEMSEREKSLSSEEIYELYVQLFDLNETEYLDVFRTYNLDELSNIYIYSREECLKFLDKSRVGEEDTLNLEQ